MNDRVIVIILPIWEITRLSNVKGDFVYGHHWQCLNGVSFFLDVCSHTTWQPWYLQPRLLGGARPPCSILNREEARRACSIPNTEGCASTTLGCIALSPVEAPCCINMRDLATPRTSRMETIDRCSGRALEQWYALHSLRISPNSSALVHRNLFGRNPAFFAQIMSLPPPPTQGRNTSSGPDARTPLYAGFSNRSVPSLRPWRAYFFFSRLFAMVHNPKTEDPSFIDS